MLQLKPGIDSSHWHTRLFVLFLLLASCFHVSGSEITPFPASGPQYFQGMEYYRVDVRDYCNIELHRLKNQDAVKYWSLIGDDMLLVSTDKRSPFFVSPGSRLSRFDMNERLIEPYWALRRGADNPLKPFMDQIDVLYDVEGFTLFQAHASVMEQLYNLQEEHFILVPFRENLEFLIPAERLVEEARRSRPGIFETPGVKRIPAPDTNRMASHIQALEGFVTRYTYTDSYVRSAEWALQQFEDMGYQVEFHEYTDSGHKQLNVVAQMPDLSDEFYVICAHLDSISENPRVLAPGADDNASGVAGTLELAALFADSPWADNLRFVLFAGEEVGLKGSRAYVRSLADTGELSRLKGVVNLDMIGYDMRPPLSGLIETRRFAEDFIVPFVITARELDIMEVSVSFYAWGSDHVPFLDRHVPTFLFIEGEYASNPNYHKTTDTFEYINMDLVTSIVKIVARTLERIFLSQ